MWMAHTAACMRTLTGLCCCVCVWAGGAADGAWAAVRRTVGSAGPGAVAAVEAAATAGAAELSPVLALLQPAVWLVVRWAEARNRTLQVCARVGARHYFLHHAISSSSSHLQI